MEPVEPPKKDTETAAIVPNDSSLDPAQPVSLMPRTVLGALPGAGGATGSDEYYSKLSDFYSEWSTYQEEMSKLKKEEAGSTSFGLV